MQEADLKTSIKSGLNWTMLSKLARQLFQLVFIFILSRLLGPEEFGIMAMVTSLSMLAEIIRDMGTNAAIIQSRSGSDDLYNTAFCFNLMLGIVVYALFYLIAPLMADFFHQPALTDMIRVFAVVYIIGSFNIVQEALLQKKLEFKRLFYIDLFSVIISGSIAIYLAWQGYGTWALVVQYICMIIISTIILWITSSWKPRLYFKPAVFKEIRNYSFSLFGHHLLHFAGREADKFLIGRFLGSAVLGIYQRAYMLMSLPLNQVNLIISRVMFPAFSRLQDNIPEMKRLYLKATGRIAFITFPMMAIIFALAEPLITVVLGIKWLGVVPLLKIFCIYSMIDSVGITTWWIYKALGRTDIMFKWGVFSTCILITTAIISLRWGAAGIATGYTLVQLTILWIPGWMIAFRLIGLNIRQMLAQLYPIFLNALAVAGLGSLLHYWLKDQVSALFLLLIGGSCCISLYIFLAKLTQSEGLKFITRTIGKKFSLK